MKTSVIEVIAHAIFWPVVLVAAILAVMFIGAMELLGFLLSLNPWGGHTPVTPAQFDHVGQRYGHDYHRNNQT